MMIRSGLSFRPGCRVSAPTLMAGVGLTLGLSIGLDPARAADTFRQLKQREIRTKIAGMEFTDEVHWAFVFSRDGTLPTFSMGTKRVGRWRIDRDMLCLDRSISGLHCYEVWISGNALQLHEPGVEIREEGILQKPAVRN
ncbi:hypothetical protein [Beijerinckia indica]|uniref:Uncharacterized protein n=1 Tax=Beijerinckia indica subsp. indica (strain ATCC 9039 / DSM 1715 / NCIMB 8712) TaxID=395963 RepID=B2IIH6_BEII9|nr:hypothetical protein [Beijerinckia indica]ACB96129.1 hypothetical protein Bind_2527 [Beijerinckia indica subsp. indica ATCC 9039]